MQPIHVQGRSQKLGTLPQYFGYIAQLLGTSMRAKVGYTPPAKTGYAPITFECIAQLLGALMRAKIGYTPAKTGYASTTVGYAVINDEQNTNEK